jgi:hypothetical protein
MLRAPLLCGVRGVRLTPGRQASGGNGGMADCFLHKVRIARRIDRILVILLSGKLHIASLACLTCKGHDCPVASNERVEGALKCWAKLVDAKVLISFVAWL